MTLHASTLFAIFAMAAATLATRFGGLLLLRHVKMGERARKALNAVPAAVLMAVVTPTAFATGIAEAVACAVTAVAAMRLSLLPAAATGVVAVALLRGIGF